MLDRKYKVERMAPSEDRRLQYLLKYHHSLAISSSSRGIGAKLSTVEKEIERLLEVGEGK